MEGKHYLKSGEWPVEERPTISSAIYTFSKEQITFLVPSFVLYLPLRRLFIRTVSSDLPSSNSISFLYNELINIINEPLSYHIKFFFIHSVSFIILGEAQAFVYSLLFENSVGPTEEGIERARSQKTVLGCSKLALRRSLSLSLTCFLAYPLFYVALPLLNSSSEGSLWYGTTELFKRMFTGSHSFYSALGVAFIQSFLLVLPPLLASRVDAMLGKPFASVDELDSEELMERYGDEIDEIIDGDEYSGEELGEPWLRWLWGVTLVLGSSLMTSTVIVPLETVLCRLVLYPDRHTGVIDCVKYIYSNYGWQGFFRGILPFAGSDYEFLVPKTLLSYFS